MEESSAPQFWLLVYFRFDSGSFLVHHSKGYFFHVSIACPASLASETSLNFLPLLHLLQDFLNTWHSPEISFSRGYCISAQLELPSQLFPIVCFLWLFSHSRKSRKHLLVITVNQHFTRSKTQSVLVSWVTHAVYDSDYKTPSSWNLIEDLKKGNNIEWHEPHGWLAYSNGFANA